LLRAFGFLVVLSIVFTGAVAVLAEVLVVLFGHSGAKSAAAVLIGLAALVMIAVYVGAAWSAWSERSRRRKLR
jgi:hypothetical protein